MTDSIFRSRFRRSWLWFPVLSFLYLLLCVLFTPQLIYDGKFGSDPDNTLRAVQVRNLIETGDWFNTRELRLEPPFGVEPFSRLVDLPLAAIAMPLSHIVSFDQAILAAAFIVPFLILLPLLFASGWWAYRPLVGRDWAWLAAPVFATSICFVPEFMPGRIDHHNWQILLALLGFGTVLRLLLADEKASGWLGFALALICTTAFAIGVEALPHMVLLLGCVGVKLLIDPKPIRKPALILGLFLPVLMFDYMYLLRAPSRWYEETLIAPSFLWVKLMAAIGFVFILSAWIVPAIRQHFARAFVMALLAALAAGALYIDTPDLFLKNVFIGFESWYADFTRQNISEQQPFIYQPHIWQSVALGSMLACIGYIAALQAAPASRRWIYRLLIFLLAIIVIAVLAYARRFVRFWPIFEVPGIILCLRYGLAYIGRYPLGRWRTGAEIALVLLCIPFAHSWISVALADREVSHLVTEPVVIGNSEKCNMTNAGTFLRNAYPQPKTILTGDTVGPQLIYNTPHTVIGGGIYNNAMGVAVTRKFFLGNEQEALDVARLHKIDLIFICQGRALLPQSDDEQPPVTTGAQRQEQKSPWFKLYRLPGWLKPVDMTMDKDDLLLEVVLP